LRINNYVLYYVLIRQVGWVSSLKPSSLVYFFVTQM
jgi:hypothetical protein